MKFNKNLKGFICMALALIMIFGSTFAYFTDRADTSANGTAGTVGVELTSDINLLDEDGKDILNPGDLRDSSFSVENTGNKSIDVRTTIVLTSSVPMTTGANGQAEYELYLRDDVHFVEGEGWKPNDGAQPVQVRSISEDGKTITYNVPDYILNGNEDFGDNNREIEDGVTTDFHDNDFVLVFAGSQTDNDFQASTVQIDVLVEAKQHRNTGAGWDIVAQESYNSGNINQNAVLEAESSRGAVIPVTAKDVNGNDLNATAAEIIGSDKDDLLNSLEESGLATAADVDALIEVESDDFDGLAETTFDVSEIANEGDTVVILHYDEATQEWEYVTTDTVDANGTVGGDFSSYSPVAFVVIPAGSDDTEETEPAGLYATDGSFTPWADLVNNSLVVVEDNSLTSADTSLAGRLVTDPSLKTIGLRAFNGCTNLTAVTISEGLESIGNAAFMSCTNLTTVEIPSTVTYVGNYIFDSCPNVTTVTVDENNSVYDSRNNCNAIIETSSNTLIAGCVNTIIPESVETIATRAFYRNTGLTEIVIPEGVKTIGNGAFFNCTNITSIKLPSTITTLEKQAFYGLTNLQTVEYAGTEEQWNNNVTADSSWKGRWPSDLTITYLGE